MAHLFSMTANHMSECRFEVREFLIPYLFWTTKKNLHLNFFYESGGI